MAKDPNPFAWFDQARFGLFIHWGLYSVLGRGEQVLFRERLNQHEYEKLAGRFNPKRFNANDWASKAKSAGMKYAVLTAKHHDGFCLFNSELTDYTSVRCAAKRDIVAEYVNACRAHGIKVGLYYSLGDWRFPAYFKGPKKDAKGFAEFREYIHGQIHELCINYGKIDLLWFDGGWPHDAEAWQSILLDRMIRKHQPHVLINDRLHGGGDGNIKPAGKASLRRRGYFDTAEQRSATDTGIGRPIETVRTTQYLWWGYCRGDRLWKSPKQVINLLSEAVSSGANLLLNVGPKADGAFPAPFEKILQETGRWLTVNRQAIYNCGKGILDVSTLGRTTTRDHCLYLHVSYWPGQSANLFGLANRVRSASLLGIKRPLRVEQQGLHVRLHGLPVRSPDPSCTVIKLTVEGVPKEHKSVIHLWEQKRDLTTLSDWAAHNGVPTDQSHS